jgi:hypothetical protein
MKKLFWGLFALILIAVVSLWFFDWEPQTMRAKDLPWEIETTSNGAIRVFGITLGETTLDEASRHFAKVPEMAVFIGAAGPESIEAYYGKTKVGLFDAKVVLILAANPAILAQVAETAGKPEPMPSGSWKRPISEESLDTVLKLPVQAITYVPSVHYETDIVLRRFGEPADKLRHDEHSEYWFYPTKGLVILLDSEGKELLQYVSPSDFDALRQRIIAQQQTDKQGMED